MSKGQLTIRPLTPDRWPDVETVFNGRGCSVARGCWCMYYRVSGSPAIPSGQTRAQVWKRELKTLAAGEDPPGLLGYLDQTPVGWVSLGPRGDFAKLARSPVMKPVDDLAVWSIVCFVVPSLWRGQGVARGLLQGAITYARNRGARILEAYPVERAERSSDESMWFGSKSMYDAAGFTVVARRKPERPIVRLSL